MELYDRSRKLVGDRWQVTLVALIEIPVELGEVENCCSYPNQKYDPIDLLGEKVVFEKTLSLHFCKEKDKARILRNFYHRIDKTINDN